MGLQDEDRSRNLPWVEKYRPKTLQDLISHEDIISTIQHFIDEDHLPHLLFYGPPGTGKTSTILACARRLYSPKEFNSMVLELNASDDRGINVVRDQILSFASTRTIFKSGFKLIILDEADAMTNDAQNALRRIVEKFTENVRFCLICNYLSKIIPAIQSRCTRFRFGPLSSEQILPRLNHVIEEESVQVTEDGKKALLALSGGDMRKVLNILQSTAMAYKEVSEDNVYTCVGHPLRSDITNIINWMLNEDFQLAYKSILFTVNPMYNAFL
ncbi:replication factor C subunit 5-like, partial [Penaeus indicus]|uniref:replication factor C subunit 5-like n=1 Tax=Penaeus indicus TaxID=29960 RepID=UPI00300C14AA